MLRALLWSHAFCFYSPELIRGMVFLPLRPEIRACVAEAHTKRVMAVPIQGANLGQGRERNQYTTTHID
jgi:hypothetical protein